MELISNWKDAWKWFSVQGIAAAGVIQGLWFALPVDARATAPEWIVNIATIAALVYAGAGRFVNQTKTDAAAN